VSYDWELDYVPLEFKSDAEAEKVRRRAASKDYARPLAEAAKILGVKEPTLRAHLSRNADRFPAKYRKGSRGRRVRILTDSEIARLDKELLATGKRMTVPPS